MKRADFILDLVKFRMARHAMRASGYTATEAMEGAEAAVKRGGMVGLFGGAKDCVRSTPEGAIVHMAEVYLSCVREHFRPGVSVEETSRSAAAAIERHRGTYIPGRQGYPTTIHEYILYRTLLEAKPILGVEPETIGLWPDTVIEMIKASVSYVAGEPVKIELQPAPSTRASSGSTCDDQTPVPFDANLPDVSVLEASRVFHSASYHALLVRNARSWGDRGSATTAGRTFPLTFVVFNSRLRVPILYVTLEEGIFGTKCVGGYDGSGAHLNLGPAGELWGNEQAFVVRALAVTKACFGQSFQEMARR